MYFYKLKCIGYFLYVDIIVIIVVKQVWFTYTKTKLVLADLHRIQVSHHLICKILILIQIPQLHHYL